MFRYLPEQGSEVASKIDWVNNLVTDLSVFFTAVIVGAMLYFAVRYRRRNGVDHETPQIVGSHFLEIVWTVVPTIVCIFLGYYGVVTFREIRQVEPDAFTINVKGYQWRWVFTYDNGKQLTNEAVIPVDKPVRFVLTSDDVLHSFFVPVMRVKADAIPNRYTYVTFRPVKTGDFHIFCAEYCGTNHSGMLGRLRVVSPAEYDRWLNDRSDELAKQRMTPAKLGEALYTEKGCKSCHSIDGTRVVGPSFLNLFGKKESLADGSTVDVDENYIRESIMTPNAKIVQSFPPNVMPAFATTIQPAEIDALIAFIRAQKGEAVAQSASAAPQAGGALPPEIAKASEAAQRGYTKVYLAPEKQCSACHTIDGSPRVGPSFKGVWGKTEALEGGSTAVVDEAYVTESIKNPTAKVVKGFPPAMPPLPLSDDEIKDVIEMLKALK